jgi:hypothetical protein
MGEQARNRAFPFCLQWLLLITPFVVFAYLVLNAVMSFHSFVFSLQLSSPAAVLLHDDGAQPAANMRLVAQKRVPARFVVQKRLLLGSTLATGLLF